MAPTRQPKDDTRAIVLSIKKEQFRKELFSVVDRAPARHVIRSSDSKRVIDLALFTRIQAKIDAYARVRVSLVDVNPDGSMSVIVADTKPHTPPYDEILRRVRFAA